MDRPAIMSASLRNVEGGVDWASVRMADKEFKKRSPMTCTSTETDLEPFKPATQRLPMPLKKEEEEKNRVSFKRMDLQKTANLGIRD